MAIGFRTRYRSSGCCDRRRGIGAVVHPWEPHAYADTNPHANEDAAAVPHRHYRDANPYEDADSDIERHPNVDLHVDADASTGGGEFRGDRRQLAI